MLEQAHRTRSSAGNWFCAALLWMLFAEWLRPLYAIPELTEMYQQTPFIIAIGGFLLLHVCGIRFGWSMLLHGLLIMGIVSWFFYEMWLWEFAWWKTYGGQLRKDLHALLSGNWTGLSGESRTVLFLAGWAMILYAVYTIAAVRRHTAWFVGITVLYLFLMQGWAGIDTTWGIVRVTAAGVLLQIGLTISRTLFRQEAEGEMSSSSRIELPFRWMVTAIVATSLWLTGVFMLSPDKPDSLTKLPFPEGLFTSDSGFAEEARTGYSGTNDRLGSPVKSDLSIAFTAMTDQLTYWRGAVRYSYTGSGWEERISTESISAGHVNLSDMDKSETNQRQLQIGDADLVEQEVWLHDRSLYGEWFSSGTIVDIVEATDENGEAVGAQGRFAHYKIRAVVPPTPGRIASRSDYEDAARSNRLSEEERQAEQQARELQLALQLPDAVPVRITDLAASIVGEEKDTLRAAVLVRDYLRREFAYTLTETAQPATGTDFVDHFLFVQQQGYCDHFSTAMVVMLRTLDIPARWVKGYAPGEITEVKDGKLATTVRQADAHSWVEVWDDRWGWVLFEPTPAYTAELAPEPVVEAGEVTVPATASIQVPREKDVLPPPALWFMAARYWLMLAVDTIGSWNWWLLFGVTGMSGMTLLAIVRGGEWLHKRGSTIWPRRTLSRDTISWYEQWQVLERKYGGRRPSETPLEFSWRIPADSEQERKQWIRLAEQLYAHIYRQKGSRKSDESKNGQ